MVPTPLFSVILDVAQVAQHLAGVGQLGADKLKTCCLPETKLGPSMWSTLKGLVGEAAGAAG